MNQSWAPLPTLGHLPASCWSTPTFLTVRRLSVPYSLSPLPSSFSLCVYFNSLLGRKKTLAHRPEDTVHHGWGEVTSTAVRPYSMACSHLRRPEAKRVEATLGYTLKFFCCLELTSANLLKQHHQLWFKCMRFGRHL